MTKPYKERGEIHYHSSKFQHLNGYILINLNRLRQKMYDNAFFLFFFSSSVSQPQSSQVFLGDLQASLNKTKQDDHIL